MIIQELAAVDWRRVRFLDNVGDLAIAIEESQAPVLPARGQHYILCASCTISSRIEHTAPRRQFMDLFVLDQWHHIL